uniref:Uncharacterized protein n=1 Tax=viral metagenome TaxID=1070528 RepID=A0A6M3XM13_9ZZZZ
MKNVQIEVILTGSFEVEESTVDKAILSGNLLKLDSVTGNGRRYRFEEGEQIAKDITGQSLFFGVDPKTNKHLRGKKYQVGKVLKAWVDKAKKIIKGLVEIWNTKTYPKIVEEVKSGWGFSIGGDVKALRVIVSGGRLIMECIGMIARHLQLIKPNVPRGQKVARVEGKQAVEETITVEETISFEPCPWVVCNTDEICLAEPRRVIEEHHIIFE